MRVWKQILILLVLAALGAGGWFAYERYGAKASEEDGRRGGRAVTVEVAPVRRATLSRTVEAVGTSRARRSVEITPMANGTLEALSVVPGGAVEKGALLARLDDAIARADLTEAEAVFKEADRAAKRARSLRGSNAVAASSVEQAISRLAVAEAALERARSRLKDREIRAPFGGMTGLAETDIGARVEAGDMITRLDDLSEIEVEFTLPETLFAEVRKDMAVSASAAAFPGRAFSGVIAFVDSRIDPAGRSFRARARIPNPDGALPAGMFMSLTLTLSEAEALVVPEEAIIVQAADSYVFIVEDGKTARRQSVVTGQRQAGVVAVEAGVDEGDIVIIRGHQKMRDGGALTIKDRGT